MPSAAAADPADEGRYIVMLHDDVEQSPGDVALEHIALYGGMLHFVYEHAIKGYSISGLSVAGAEAIAADPRVAAVEPDGIVCAAVEGPDGCDREEPTAPEAPRLDSPSETGDPVVAALAPPTPQARTKGHARRGKRCRGKGRKVAKKVRRCSRQQGG